jgi:hypothetical protein
VVHGFRVHGHQHRLSFAIFTRRSARAFSVDRLHLVIVSKRPASPGGSGGKWPYYTRHSYWRQPVRRAPRDRHSAYFMANWKAISSNQRINLAASASYSWALFHSDASDPVIRVRVNGQTFRFHAPRRSRPSPGDNEITVVDRSADRGRGVMYEFGAVSSWHPAAGRGAAGYRAVSYLKSNGLDGRLRQSNERRNVGHRGLSCMTFGYIFKEVRARAIHHLLKIGVPRTGASRYSRAHVWPYVDDEGDSSNLPEGTRVRLKESARRKIHAIRNPYARAMARALYKYGAIISDQGGSGLTIKLQWPKRWSSLGIRSSSLSSLRISDFEVVKLGWKG